MTNTDSFNFGSVQIHKHVLAEIVASAIDGVEGIALAEEMISSKLMSFLGKKNLAGITIKTDSNNDVSLDLKVVVQYGRNIPDAALQVQEAVKDAVSKALDINLKDVNVNVQGIQRGGQE